jgi:hypothetical protein
MRRLLTNETSLEDFHKHYWYLAELVDFCRRYEIDPYGRKDELILRIEKFLRTGRRTSKTPRKATRLENRQQGPITLDAAVTTAFKCNSATREFFQSVIGEHFHFTAHLQQFRREHQRKGTSLTYGDLVREWISEFERRKDKSYKPKIGRTGQYNQFVRDFMADKARNSGKSIREAAAAWTRIREHEGPHTYAEYRRIARAARTPE